MHGDSHKYPTGDLTEDKQPYLLTLGVVNKLPVHAILGWDLPVLLKVLLTAKDTGLSTAFLAPVLTQAQARAGTVHKSEQDKEAEPEPFSYLDSLFKQATKGQRKSRQLHRAKRGLPQGCWTEQNDTEHLWEVPGNIGDIQKEDETLKSLYTKAVWSPGAIQRGRDLPRKQNFGFTGRWCSVSCDSRGMSADDYPLLEVEEMQHLGLIEPLHAEWCSPVVFVVKKDGSLHICIDFQKLNAILDFNAYLMLYRQVELGKRGTPVRNHCKLLYCSPRLLHLHTPKRISKCYCHLVE